MFSTAQRILDDAVAEHAFPAAVIEVGSTTQPLWTHATGRLSFAATSPAAAEDTVFDLASLTKVLATTPLVMQWVERGLLGLDDLVTTHLPAWRSDDRRHVTIRDLLSHCSGLPAHEPYFRSHQGRAAFEHAICSEPLAYEPRTAAVYSDLGFMLLGFILEESLRRSLQGLMEQMGVVDPLQFLPPELWRHRTAPTSYDPWRGKQLCGEVDDENAAAIGGVAGHAGLFGTAAAVGTCARHLLQVLDGRTGAFARSTLMEFVACRSDVPSSSRALGWDTMRPTSSCGTRMSTTAFGHTGFTGTSLWIDPERAVYVVLLTNRVYPDRANQAIQSVRRRVHDAVMDALLSR